MQRKINIFHRFFLLNLVLIVSFPYQAQADPPRDFCKRDSYGRAAGTIPDTCPPGTSLSGALCYRGCPAGYNNIAGVCWKGWESAGILPPEGKTCSEGKEPDAGLCYEKCRPDYKGAGLQCRKICKDPTPYECGGFCTSDDQLCALVGAASAATLGLGTIFLGVLIKSCE
jgi:hypothetical protein